MNRCPITYELCGESLYSEKGLKLLAPTLRGLKTLQFTAAEQREEAFHRSVKMSVQGVQPCLLYTSDAADE